MENHFISRHREDEFEFLVCRQKVACSKLFKSSVSEVKNKKKQYVEEEQRGVHRRRLLALFWLGCAAAGIELTDRVMPGAQHQ